MTRILHALNFGVREASHKKLRPMRSFFEEVHMVYPSNSPPEAQPHLPVAMLEFQGHNLSLNRESCLMFVARSFLLLGLLSCLRARDYILIPTLNSHSNARLRIIIGSYVFGNGLENVVYFR